MAHKVEVAGTNGNEKIVVEDAAEARPATPPAPIVTSAGVPPAPAATPKAPPEWHVFLRTANTQEIRDRLASEIGDILKSHNLGGCCCLCLFEPENSIDSYDLDQVFSALQKLNPKNDKDVVLFILSRGGEGEPAYQISKLCKSYAHEKFIRRGTATCEVRRDPDCHWCG